MSAAFIAFFNNKGGVGKTSLVYHLAWMYADLGARVVAADLDPQANLTAAFLDEDRLEELWPDNDHRHTIFGCVQPLIQGVGDIADPLLEYVADEPSVADQLALVVGDLALSGFEDELSAMWPDCLDRKERAFRVISAFWRILQRAATIFRADIVLIDLGPNLGAMNRAALIAADYVIVPLAPDLFSLRGLSNLGPTLRRWRAEWRERRVRNPVADLALPRGVWNLWGTSSCNTLCVWTVPCRRTTDGWPVSPKYIAAMYCIKVRDVTLLSPTIPTVWLS